MSTIFKRIIDHEIPADVVYEDDLCLAFRDVSPQAPVHVLVIPKGKYVNFDHFAAEASDAELVDFMRTAAKVCAMTGVTPDGTGDGYRTIANAGSHGVQEVPHYHMHILGGRILGRMLQRMD